MLTQWRKARARRTAAAVRRVAFETDPQAGALLARHFPDEIWPPLHSIAAGYFAIRDEIDPRPLMETFHCEQVRLALPCVTGPDQPLVFRSWSPGDELVKGTFAISEPRASATEVRPSLVLLPLLAFDGAGRRLGYGAGFYDRTIETLRALGPVTTVGLAYEAQRLKRVPTAGHDAPLDWIVTEQGAYFAAR